MTLDPNNPFVPMGVACIFAIVLAIVLYIVDRFSNDPDLVGRILNIVQIICSVVVFVLLLIQYFGA